MKKALAEGEIKFQTSYQLPTPPDPEIISCRIDGARLFPVFLDPGEVLVFGYFTTAVCYSYKNDGGSRGYHVVTQTHNLAEQILKMGTGGTGPFSGGQFPPGSYYTHILAVLGRTPATGGQGGRA